MIELTASTEVLATLDNHIVAYSVCWDSVTKGVIAIERENYTDLRQRAQVAELIAVLQCQPAAVLEILNQFDELFGCYSDYNRGEELWAVSGILETRYGIMLWWKDDGNRVLEVSLEN